MSADGQRAFRGLRASSQEWSHPTRAAATGHQLHAVRPPHGGEVLVLAQPTNFGYSAGDTARGGVVTVKAHGFAGGAMLAWAPRVGQPAIGQDPVDAVCGDSVRNGCSAGTANDAAVTVGLQQDGDQSAARGRTEPRRRRWTRVQTRAIALLAFTLMAMPAAGDVRPQSGVVWPDDFLDNRGRPLDHLDRDDSRINEVFPVKHRCSEVLVLIHAQRRTEERMIESCNALKWAADRFHALMQTNPSDAVAEVNVYGHLTTVMEMFVLDRNDPEYRNYLTEFWDLGDIDFAGIYLGGIAVVAEREDGLTILPTEVHEYVHNLQYDFVSGWLGARLPIWIEGAATFIQLEYIHTVLRNDWYGPPWAFDIGGWEAVEEMVVPRAQRHGLPQLTAFLDEHGDQWQDLLDEYAQWEIEYNWGAWVIRFLDERHSAALSSLREMFEGEHTRDLWLETGTRVHDLMVRLNDDWHAWHEDLATLSVANRPERIIIIKRDQMTVDLGHFFRTINALAFDVYRLLAGGPIPRAPIRHCTSLWPRNCCSCMLPSRALGSSR